MQLRMLCGPLAKKQLAIENVLWRQTPHASQNPIEINFSKLNRKIKFSL